MGLVELNIGLYILVACVDCNVWYVGLHRVASVVLCCTVLLYVVLCYGVLRCVVLGCT